MSTCNFTTQISETLCIGDSLPIINSNFDTLDTTLCNLSGTTTQLINNLNAFGNTFGSSIFNILNILNTPTITGIVNISPSYSVYQRTIYCSGGTVYGTSFVLPSIIPSNATFLLLRGDYTDSPFGGVGQTITATVNGSQLPISSYQISDTTSYAYLTVSKNSIYNVIYSSDNLCPRGGNASLKDSVFQIRILGYF